MAAPRRPRRLGKYLISANRGSGQVQCWVTDFIDERAAFPNGAHDDQVDAMTQALLRWHMIPQEIVIQFSQPYQISPY